MSNYATSVTQTSNIEVILTLTMEDSSTKSLTVREGDILDQLVYKENSEYKTVTGKVKVINFRSKAKTAKVDGCIHDDTSVFNLYVVPVSLTIDCSTEYHNNVVIVPIIDIKDINVG